MNAATVSEAIRLAGPAKVVARTIGCSPRTVERWRNGWGEPPATTIFKLMTAYRHVASYLLDQSGLSDAAMDAEQAELLDRLAELRTRKASLPARLAMAGASAALGRAQGLNERRSGADRRTGKPDGAPR